MFENNPAAQIVGIDLRLAHSWFVSVEVQHECTSTMLSRNDCGGIVTLASLLPVLGAEKERRNFVWQRNNKVIRFPLDRCIARFDVASREVELGLPPFSYCESRVVTWEEYFRPAEE